MSHNKTKGDTHFHPSGCSPYGNLDTSEHWQVNINSQPRPASQGQIKSPRGWHCPELNKLIMEPQVRTLLGAIVQRRWSAGFHSTQSFSHTHQNWQTTWGNIPYSEWLSGHWEVSRRPFCHMVGPDSGRCPQGTPPSDVLYLTPLLLSFWVCWGSGMGQGQRDLSENWAPANGRVVPICLSPGRRPQLSLVP